MKKNQKNALITGAGKGIGRQIALKLADEGYSLLLVSRDRRGLEDLTEDLSKSYADQDFTYFAADLSSGEEITDLCNWAAEHKVDVLVNNLGVFNPVALLDQPSDDILKDFHINYFTAHQLCVTLGRKMKALRQGHIINISSTASREPVMAGTYTVTKFALRGLTYVLREELRPYGVKVTEIIPGSTLTSSWEGTTHAPDRFVKAEQIADAVVFSTAMGIEAQVEEIVIRPQLGNITADSDNSTGEKE